MPRTKISEFSATAGSNTDIDGINIAEGCSPSGINDAIRELMAQLKDFQAGTAGDSFNGPVGTSTAAAGAFTTLTTSSTVTHNGGTANGVAYLNGSKVLTTGSALTFDGSTLTATTTSGIPLVVTGTGSVGARIVGGSGAGAGSYLSLQAQGGNAALVGTEASIIGSGTSTNLMLYGYGSNSIIMAPSTAEVARFTSTGLGIGTSSPKIQEWRAGTYLTVANASTRGQVEIDCAVADSSSASLGALIFTYSTNTTNHKDVALIEATSSGATANQRGGVLNFYTKANGTASPALNMTLDSSGNLGIGTSSPGVKLDVRGASGTGISFIETSSGNSNRIQLGTGAGVGFVNADAGAGTIALALQVAGSTKATLDSSGNLGIGTSSPGAKLDVNGAIYSRTGGLYTDTVTAYSGSSISINAGSSHFAVTVNGSERARITSGGDFCIGTTSAGGGSRLHVDASGGGIIRVTRLASSATAYGQFENDGTNTTLTSSAALLFNAGGSTERARITSDGDFLVGTTQVSTNNLNGTAVRLYSGGSYLEIAHNNTATTGQDYEAYRYNGTQIGGVSQNGTTGVLFNTTSDYRLKTFISKVTDSGSRIDALNPVEYEWKADGKRTRGFFAHEFQSVYADSVTGQKDAVDEEGKPVYQAMQASSSEVIADLVAEIQSLRARVAALETK